MAYFADKGAFCESEHCHHLDFLPFRCQFCDHTYCLDHYRPEDHHCSSPTAQAQNKLVILCPMCNGSIRLTGADDPNEKWKEHRRLGGCELSDLKNESPKKCPVKGCQELLTISNRLQCKSCSTLTCIKHRLPADHSCAEMRKKNKESSSSSSHGRSVADFLRMTRLKKLVGHSSKAN